MEEEATIQPSHEEDENSEEDEMVFEAYVSPSEVTEAPDDLHLTHEELKVWTSACK